MKLRTLIIISTVVLVTISLAVPSFLALTSFSEEFEKTVTSDISILTSNSLDKVNRIMNSRIIDIQFLTSDVNLNLVGDYHSIKEKIAYLRDYEIRTQMYTSISIYDIDGIKIGDTRNLKIENDESNELFFTEAIQGKIFHDSIPVKSKSLGISIIHFSGPLFDENGNINGVLVLNFSLSKISDILDADAIYSKPIEVHLLANDGLIIYSNHIHTGILTEVTKLVKYQNFVHSTENQITFFDQDDEGYDVLFSAVKQKGFQQYEGDDWILLFDLPTSVLFEERDKEITVFVIMSGIILSISITASYIMATRISSPIRKLEIISSKMAKGDLDVKIIPEGNYEIFNLAKSFIIMRNSIKEHIELEKSLAVEKEKVKLEKINSLGQIASRLAHNLKNPLAVIKATTSIIEATSNSVDEKTQQRLNLINASIENMLNQIEDILDFVKQKPLDLKDVNLNEILNIAISNISIPKRIKINLPENDIEMTCDVEKLQVVFMNMMTNSIESIQGDGEITIDSFQNKRETVIEITDTGSIDIDSFEKMFDVLYSTKPTGTGLGLPYCKSVIEQHGGSVEVSMKPTKFTIILPLSLDKL